MYRKFIETNSGLDAAKIRKIFELCKSYAKIFENNLHFFRLKYKKSPQQNFPLRGEMVRDGLTLPKCLYL